jgi:hypothetical protein
MSIKTNIRVDDAGTQKMLATMARNAPAAFAAAIYLMAGRVMARSLRLVPVDTGSLRRSHFVAPPELQVGGRTIMILGYVAPYAGRVHEDLGAEHINGAAKFLETPFLELVQQMPRMIATDLMRLRWGTMPTVPILFPPVGVFEETGAKSRHSGKGARERDRQARSKAAERMAQRAARQGR